MTNRAYGGELFLDDLRQMGLLAHIAPRSIAVSADRGACKPNPALFEFALAGLGLTPGAVAMVGDEIAADIWGAQRSGLYAIWRPSAKLQAQALREWQSQQSQGEAHGNGEMPVEAVPLGDLIACAQKRARARDARTATMSPPDATIMRIADLLALFPPR